MTVDYTQLLATILTALLAAFLPLFHAKFAKTQAALTAQYQANTTLAQRQLISSIVTAGVLAAEQSGLSAQLKSAGAQKYQTALAYTQHELDGHGIKLDAQSIAGLIEASVLHEFNYSKVQA